MKKIYTEKDINKDPEKSEQNDIKPKLKKSYKVPAILAVVWVLIIALFGYSVWVDKTNGNTNEALGETTISPVEKETTITSPPVNMTDEQRSQAQIRDNIRLTGIKKLRSALTSYFENNDFYPSTLDDLMSDYLDEIPHNPFPGGQEFVYTGIGVEPYSYYEISYALEVGTEGINSGIHVASPDAVALW